MDVSSTQEIEESRANTFSKDIILQMCLCVSSMEWDLPKHIGLRLYKDDFVLPICLFMNAKNSFGPMPKTSNA